jgi:hypothetical protein
MKYKPRYGTKKYEATNSNRHVHICILDSLPLGRNVGDSGGFLLPPRRLRVSCLLFGLRDAQAPPFKIQTFFI